MVATNLNDVRVRIAAACSRSGRKPDDVLLVAVSKTFMPEVIREAVQAGQLDFGENYVQELEQKRKTLNNPDIRWHFVGHLQSNKVRYIVEHVHLVHSVDNGRVAEEIHRRAERAHRAIDVLIEVHTTDEATKFGVAPSKAIELVKEISGLKGIKVQGLMTMGPFSDDPSDSRPSFRALVDLKNKIRAEGIENVTMRHLSMGMSHDFEIAIEEGATIVRIGTALFGKRKKAQTVQTEGEL